MTTTYPPNDPPKIGSVATTLLTFEDVEQRLVETVLLWRRMPGGGRWPFASDGPWHLVKAELYGPDVDKDAPIRQLPLRRAEVTEMETVSEWLLLVPERDRRLVVLAVTKLASGKKQVPWSELLKPLGVKFGAHGLRKRYDRAIAGIAKALNMAENRADGVSIPMVHPDENKVCPPSA